MVVSEKQQYIQLTVCTLLKSTVTKETIAKFCCLFKDVCVVQFKRNINNIIIHTYNFIIIIYTVAHNTQLRTQCLYCIPVVLKRDIPWFL